MYLKLVEIKMLQLSTAYHIIQLVVTVMGIIIAFVIAFATGS